MCDKSRNTWLCVHCQWNTLEWCQLNALQASPVVHLMTPLSCVSLSMNTQPSVPTIDTDTGTGTGTCTGTGKRKHTHTRINYLYLTMHLIPNSHIDKGIVASLYYTTWFRHRHIYRYRHRCVRTDAHWRMHAHTRHILYLGQTTVECPSTSTSGV